MARASVLETINTERGNRYGLILTVIGFFKDYTIFYEMLIHTDTFKLYLDRILIIIIGIEFLRMLCKASSDNVIEVIIFLVARHMIVSNTTPNQDFVSVVSIVLLCVVRQYLHNIGEKNHKKEDGRCSDSCEIIIQRAVQNV